MSVAESQLNVTCQERKQKITVVLALFYLLFPKFIFRLQIFILTAVLCIQKSFSTKSGSLLWKIELLEVQFLKKCIGVHVYGSASSVSVYICAGACRAWRGCQLLGAGVTGGCEFTGGCWHLKLGLLEEQLLSIPLLETQILVDMLC